MTFWTLVVAVVTLLVGVIGALAAILAAKYAREAPTKEDLKRVEDHTAHLQNVKDRITSIDTRSKQQSERDRLISDANRVSVSVSGRGVQDDPLDVNLVIKDTSISLAHIKPLNGAENIFGSAACEESGELKYVASVSSKAMFQWFNGGAAIEHFHQKRLQLKVYLKIKGEEVYCFVPVTLQTGLIGTSQGNRQIWILEGEI